MGRYQPMGQLVQVREAGEKRRRQIYAMFDRGMTGLAVSDKLGLSRTYVNRLKESWALERATANFDPALAIGTIDEFIAKPLPLGVAVKRSGKCAPKRSLTPYKERFPSKDASDEAWSVESPLLTATDRALHERTAEAYAAVLSVMGKGT